jgi:hypothetical protein
VALVVILLPSLPLFDLNSIFAVDWPNQVWLINYVSAFFAEHHQFPTVINSFRLIGMPYPVFYGYLFFPLLSVLSLAWNADLTVRLIAIALFAFQFYLVFRMAQIATRDKFCSFCLATFITWAIYPMTNLYNRGAIPEFFATGLFVCSAAIWFIVLETKPRLDRFLLCNLFVFLFVLSAGSHPITALYGACFMALLVVLTLWISRAEFKSLIIPLAIPIVLGTISLLPWVMATTKFTPRMALAASFKKVGYYPRSLDSLYARLLPFPIETKSYLHKMADDHAVAKHLDTQINFPLLALLALFLFAIYKKGGFKDKRAMASVATFGALAVLMIWSSTSPGSIDKLGHNFRTIQFAYRLITYINFSLLMGIMFCFWRQAQGPVLLRKRAILSSLLVVSFVGLGIKLFHAQQVMVPADFQLARSKSFTANLLNMPDSFYGSDAYTITNLFPELTAEKVNTFRNCPFEPLSEPFGEVKSVASPNGIGQTNIEQFPWNYIFDKQNEPVPRLEHDHRIALDMPQSTEIHYAFIPDTLWNQARRVSLWTFFLWLSGTIASLGLLLWTARQRRGEES